MYRIDGAPGGIFSKNITDCYEQHLKEKHYLTGQHLKEKQKRLEFFPEKHKKKVYKKHKTCKMCKQVLEIETCQTRKTCYRQHLKEQHMEGICILHMDKNGWKFRCSTCGSRFKDLERVVRHLDSTCRGCLIRCEVCGDKSYGTSTIMSVL